MDSHGHVIEVLPDTGGGDVAALIALLDARIGETLLVYEDPDETLRAIYEDRLNG